MVRGSDQGLEARAGGQIRGRRLWLEVRSRARRDIQNIWILEFRILRR